MKRLFISGNLQSHNVIKLFNENLSYILYEDSYIVFKSMLSIYLSIHIRSSCPVHVFSFSNL